MDNALLARVEKQAWFHRYPRGWPMLLFVLVAIVTVLSVIAIERAEAERRQLELDRNVTELASGLQRRASENIAILRAGAALVAAREDVDPVAFSATSSNATGSTSSRAATSAAPALRMAMFSEAFDEVAENLYSDGDYHGSMGIAWARWLRVQNLPAFERAVRERLGPEYRVHPVPGQGREVTVPIVHLRPMEPDDSHAIGYDMYSEPVRREAMELSASLGQPVASGRVHLVQDEDKPVASGFLIYMPVFEGEGARRSVRGFVYSPFRAQQFLGSAVELVRDRGVDIHIYDGEHRPDRLLVAKVLPGENAASMDRRIVIANRPWVVSVSMKRARALSALSRATLVFGAVLGVLVMFIARLITKRAAEDRAVLEWFSHQSQIRTSLTRELNHRVKNTLANVLSIVALTRRRSVDLDDFAENLTGRIRALSATHDLLSQSDWSNAPIAEIVRSELAPYMAESDGHVEMAGPDVSLAPNDAMSLGLGIHELATNAAKYGALSSAEGRVIIEWRLVSPEMAEVRWRETGGPPVTAPGKRGFGRDLLEKIVAHELQSKVDLRFEPDGVQCTLHVPVRQLSNFALRSAGRG